MQSTAETDETLVFFILLITGWFWERNSFTSLSGYLVSEFNLLSQHLFTIMLGCCEQTDKMADDNNACQRNSLNCYLSCQSLICLQICCGVLHVCF